MASITLQVDAGTNLAATFNFYRKNPTDASFGKTPINAAPIPVVGGLVEFTDSTVLAGHVYDYVSTDIQNGVESGFSNEVISVIVPFPPSPSAIPLGAASSFLVLGGSAVTNTGPTTVNGDVGVSPGSSITGFPPGALSGTLHNGGPSDFVSASAQAAAKAAFAAAMAALNPGGAPATVMSADIGGQTLSPGVYSSAAALGITGRLVLDAGGNPQAVFIFQIGTALTMAGDIILANGTQASNVFWAVGSSATIGTASSFVGTLMANQSITLVTNATVNGRVLAQVGAVTMDTNTISLFLSAQLSVWAPNTFFSLGTVIFDCATGTFQWVTTAGVSGATRPIFNTGTGQTTQDGTVVWTDPPIGEFLVQGPLPPTPLNVPPAPPAPPTNLRIISEVG